MPQRRDHRRLRRRRRRTMASSTSSAHQPPRRREERGHVLGGLPGDEQHLLDAREVHRGRELARSGRAPSPCRRSRARGRPGGPSGRGRRGPEVTTRSPGCDAAPSRAMNLNRTVPPAIALHDARRCACAARRAPTVDAGSVRTCTTDAPGRTSHRRGRRGRRATMTAVSRGDAVAAPAVHGERAHPAAPLARDDLAGQRWPAAAGPAARAAGAAGDSPRRVSVTCSACDAQLLRSRRGAGGSRARTYFQSR